jgi:hypothetical protein
VAVDRQSTAWHLFDACRGLCVASERETRAFLRRRQATERSAIALAAPMVAVAGVAAFLDQYGAGFVMTIGPCSVDFQMLMLFRAFR